MTLSVLMPVFALMTSLLASVVLFALPEKGHRLRTIINLAAAILKIALVGCDDLGCGPGARVRGRVHHGTWCGIRAAG
ncbi:hypothetical protein [Marinobacter sp.]|uniref:hypothetical protein n=1 Tax=Marinobacter sp. TaxID=50741 RepID=UPI00257E4A78|nr:hypothetical protein [Marinobacter sp.]